jgi:hypothetical protein
MVGMGFTDCRVLVGRREEVYECETPRGHIESIGFLGGVEEGLGFCLFRCWGAVRFCLFRCCF